VSDGASRDLTPGTANRLSIGFLLVWTLCTAVSLAIDRWDFAVHADTTAEELAYWTAYAFVFRPLNGICLAFLLVVVKRLLFWQERLPTAPGHWYLLTIAVHLVIVRSEDLVRLATPAESEIWFSGSRYSLWMSLSYGLPLMTAFAGMILMRQSIWWRVTLASMTFYWSHLILRYWGINFLPIVDPCEIGVDFLGISLHSLPAAVSILAMNHDWRVGRRHDFYHWLGILTLWLYILSSWPSLFWYLKIYG
jgi:hypothetical protein